MIHKSFRTSFLLFITAACSLFAGAKQTPVTTAEPEENRIYPIAIIGSGAGGTMAAKRAVLNNRQVLLFTGAKKEMKNSRGNWVKKVDNIPGLEKYSRTIVELRDEVLEDIVQGPLKHNLFIIKDSVVSLQKQNDLFQLQDQSGKNYLVRYVVLATGIMDEQPHIGGTIDNILPFANKQTVAYCLLCDGHRSYKKETIVFGHSEDAAKAALLLASRYEPKQVTVLTNGKKPELSAETQAELQTNQIAVIEDEITEVIGAEKGILEACLLATGEKVKAEMGFVFLGIRPNNKLALGLGANVDPRGLVITNEIGESSISNLFVIGDLRANSPKQIYTAWQHAVDSMQAIDKRIRTKQ
jgi:thioredoxin reductase (NADPH)